MRRGWGALPEKKHTFKTPDFRGMVLSAKNAAGYTIIESLIFLAVSSAMAMAVIILIAGQQGKTQFQQSVREFEVSLQDIANDVSTGNASVPVAAGKFCAIDAATHDVTLDNGAPAGASTRCIFIGRAIQFGGAGPDAETQYTVYGLVGHQRDAFGKEVTALGGASGSQAQIPGTGYTPELKEFGNGIKVISVKYDDGTGPVAIGSFGFFTTFQSYNGGNLSSGSTNVDVTPIVGTTLTDAQNAVQTSINNTITAPIKNPSGGITICLESGTSSNQRAKVQIGGNAAGPASVTTVIGDGTICL